MPILVAEGLKVTITDPNKDASGAIMYKLCVMHPQRPTVSLSRVFRRYSEFEKVFQKLLKMDPDPPLPPIPEKKTFGNTEPAFVEKRRRELEYFTNCAMQNRFLVMDMDLMILIGFTEAKVAYLADPSDLDTALTGAGMTSTTAGGGGKSTKAIPGQQAAETFEGTSWMRTMYKQDDESNLIAAHQWIRSTTFTIQHILLPMSYRAKRKTNILLQGEDKEQLILSVYNPVKHLTVGLPDDKRINYFIRLLHTMDSPCILAPVDVSFQGNRAYVVRPVTKYGSLYDKLFGAEKKPLEESNKKFGVGKDQKPKPFKLDDIALYGKQMLLYIQMCHVFNIPCSGLHLGNALLQSNGLLVFSDQESMLLGVSRYAPVLPVDVDDLDGEGDEGGEKTHMDMLRFGCCLLEMALGAPLPAMKEYRLMTIQRGDPTGATDDEAIEHEESPMASPGARTGSMSPKPSGGLQSPRGSQSPGRKSPSPAGGGGGGVLASLPVLPDPLGQLLAYIFHRNNAAKVDVLLKHDFFAKAKFKKDYKAWEGKEYAHPNLKLKKRDVELFAEASANWKAEIMSISEKRIKEVEAKQTLKEMRKTKSIRQRGSIGASSPKAEKTSSVPTSIAIPQTVNPPAKVAAPTPAAAPTPVAPPAPTPTPAPAPVSAPPKGLPPPPAPGGPPTGLPPPPAPGKGLPPPPAPGGGGLPPPPAPGGLPPPPAPGKGLPPPPPPGKGPPPPPAPGGGGGGAGPPPDGGARAALMASINARRID